MASFKARIGWKRPRKKENNYCRSVSFLPTWYQKIRKKKAKKIKKTKKYHYGSILGQNRLKEDDEKGKK